MLPREHGAYGQLLLPLATAVAIADIHASAILTSIAALAVFVAHEPLVVLLGRRGARARRDQHRRAVAWLVISGGIALAAGIGAVAATPSHARWLFAWPLAPAAVLAGLLLTGREKSALGEIASAISFAAIAIPIYGASAQSPARGFVVAFTFAGLFIVGTLGVRIVILGSRGGGDPHAVRVTRRQLAIAVALVGIGLLLMWSEVRTAAAMATLPGMAFAIGLAIRPPAARRLRAVGWTMVSATALLALVLVAAFR
jgi:hypothetical protein